MATLVSRNGKWRAQIRRAGGPSLSKTFTHKRDAQLWSRQTELELERGELPVDRETQLNGLKLADLVIRYRDTITPKKKGKEQETYWLNAFLRHPISASSVSELKTQDFATYRDDRLKTIKPVTLKRQLAVIHNLFEIARHEWGIAIGDNPLDKLRFKAQATKRERRLKDGELVRIVADASKRKNPLVLPIILFAIETGMRRGEILAMRWRDVDFGSGCLLIPETKNGYPREIPLTDKAWEIIEGLDRRTAFVFPISANCFRLTWLRIIKRLGIRNLRFHDMRHEAISSFFEKGLNIPEVASISGHKDWRMLKVYTQPKAQDIRKKLNKAFQTT